LIATCLHGNPDFSGLADNGNSPLLPLHTRGRSAGDQCRPQGITRAVLTGTGASEGRLKHELRGSTRSCTATHGLIDGAEPTRSSVALSPDAKDDGYFHTSKSGHSTAAASW
jgi:hypothetical protein